MPDKPRLVILDTQTIRSDRVRAILKEQFDVVISPDMPRPLIGEHQAAALLEAIGEGVALVDAQGVVIWANSAIDQLPAIIRERLAELCFGEVEARKRAESAPSTTANYESDHEITSKIDSKPHGKSDSKIDTAQGNAPTTNTANTTNTTKATGTAGTELPRIFSVHFSPCPDACCEDPDSPECDTSHSFTLAMIVREQTRDRQLYNRLKAVDRAGRDLLRIDRDTVRTLGAVERLKQLETKIVGYAQDLLNFDHFAIRMLDANTNKLELIISYGLPPEAAELDIYATANGNGIAGRVACTGKSERCDDSLNDIEFLPLCEGARSALVLPLKQFGRVVGVLDAESLEPNAFTKEDLRFTRIFARSIAMAIHMLDLLVTERTTTNKTVTGQVVGEIREPLDDIIAAIDTMRTEAGSDPASIAQLDRILNDVENIKSRTNALSDGPQTLLGVDKAMSQCEADPIVSGIRVLIADDEPKIRKLIGDVLRKRKAEVIVCDSGSDAIEKISAMAGGNGHLDLVLSDISMKKSNGEPDRNGYEVFSAAKKVFPDVPVILMTGFGYDPHHSIVRASQEGLHATLFKPFQVERLLTEIRAAVGNDATSA